MKFDILFHVDSEDEKSMKLALNQAANYKREAVLRKSKVSPLEIAVNAAAGALETPDPFHVVVVVNGPAVKLLTRDHEELLGRAQEAVANGVKFHAGSYAMKNYGVPADDLWTFVEVVPSATLDIVELQHQGYAYVKP